MISFRVDGKPIPQGSMKVIHGNIIHSQGSALAAWRSAVGLGAKLAGARPHADPVEISLIFIVARPRTVNRLAPSVPPDLDKLVRAVLDGLTAIAYRDDAQVCTLTATKEYGDRPGVQVYISKK